MKKLLLFGLAVALMAACAKNEDAPQTTVDAPEGNGIISVAATPSATIETRAQMSLPQGTTIPAGGDFSLSISSTDSRDEVFSRCEQFRDRQGCEAGVGGRERSASLNLGGHRVKASGRAFILEGTLADVLAKRQAQRACFGIR